jgi:hypothetical protein
MDRTWETEDCTIELADYFICQTEEEKGKCNIFYVDSPAQLFPFSLSFYNVFNASRKKK